MQGGVISGRILDSAVRPAAGAQVTAARVFYQDGRPVLGPARSITADDRGDYRLFWLEPGEYLVLAEKSLPTGRARGYFPGGDDARAAMTVNVGEGTESSRTDFSLGQIPASVTVSGAVTSVVPGFETRLAVQSKDSLPPPPTPADVRAIQAGAALQFYLLPMDAAAASKGRLCFKIQLPIARTGLRGNSSYAMCEADPTSCMQYWWTARASLRSTTSPTAPSRSLPMTLVALHCF